MQRRRTRRRAILAVLVLVTGLAAVAGVRLMSVPPAMDVAYSTVDAVLADVRELVEAGRFEEATRLLNAVDETQLTDLMRAEGRAPAQPETFRYLAYAEETIIIPGVSPALEDEILRSRAYREIPGTGDDVAIGEAPLSRFLGSESPRDRWFDAVHRFAFRVNQWALQQTNAVPDRQMSDGG